MSIEFDRKLTEISFDMNSKIAALHGKIAELQNQALAQQRVIQQQAHIQVNSNQSGSVPQQQVQQQVVQQQSQQQQQQQQPQSQSQSTSQSRTSSVSPGNEIPPTFDNVIGAEDWVGIDDVLATGDIDDLMT
eukprot:689238_1